MTSTTLKWIALITMVIDHVGAIFFQDIEILRIIGRVSFPIFAFLLSQGFTHTRSKTMYALRLLLFALISEIPYDLLFSGRYINWYSQSVMCELFIAFCALIFTEMAIKKNPLWILLTFVCAFLSEILYCSYGLYGVCIIIAFYLLRSFRGADVLAFIAITYLFYNVMFWSFTFEGWSYEVLQLNELQMYSVFAAVAIVFYNGKRSKNNLKWLFYIIYPVHLALLYYINMLVYSGTLPRLW